MEEIGSACLTGHAGLTLWGRSVEVGLSAQATSTTPPSLILGRELMWDVRFDTFAHQARSRRQVVEV